MTAAKGKAPSALQVLSLQQGSEIRRLKGACGVMHYMITNYSAPVLAGLDHERINRICEFLTRNINELYEAKRKKLRNLKATSSSE